MPAILVLIGPALCRTALAADPPASPPPSADASEDKRPAAALAACASGEVAKGVAILGELYAETRNPAYVFNQGRCYQKNGQLEPARHRFAEYIRIGVSEPPPDIQRARDFVNEIDDTLARQRAREAAAAAAIESPAGSSPAAGSGRRARALRIGSVVLAGVGVAAVGVGAIMSVKVKSTNDDIDRQFAGGAYVTDGAALQRKIADGERYETWQWIGYGVGVAALAGAVTTFILGGSVLPWADDKVAVLDVTPSVSAHGAGGAVRLRF